MSGENLQIVGEDKDNLAVEQLKGGDGTALEEVDYSPLPACIAVDGPPAKVENAEFNKSIVQIGDVFVLNKLTRGDSENDPQFVPDAINKLDRLNTELNNTVIINAKEPLKEKVKSIKLLKYKILKYTLISVCTMAMIAGLIFGAVIAAYNAIDAYDEHINSNTTFRLVTRKEWGAIKGNKPSHVLAINPPDMAIISHTAGSTCTTFRSCSQVVRSVQADQLSRGFIDISYNFLVGGDGNVYAGRGWGLEGAHTRFYNNRSIGIAFIGNFVNIKPPKKQVDAGRDLIEAGHAAGKIAQFYKVYGQKQLRNTQSPGEMLMEEIRKWPSWEPFERKKNS